MRIDLAAERAIVLEPFAGERVLDGAPWLAFVTAIAKAASSCELRNVRAASAELRSLAAGNLPGAGDFETSFSPGRAHVRRVGGYNIWVLYRFDAEHVFVLTARSEPPVPLDA